MKKLSFLYFEGPEIELAGLLKGSHPCSLCGALGVCFDLDDPDCCSRFHDRDRKGKAGCVDCLRKGAFEFDHNTEFGVLEERGFVLRYTNHRPAPPTFSKDALRELRRTPGYTTWQEPRWLAHCNDFMVYEGTWMPEDFRRHAADGDGRALFLAMTEPDDQLLWDESLPSAGAPLTDWHATYYVFQCRRCGVRRGNWDCD